MTGSLGCEQISSRREIQEGNKLYGEGRYSKAIEQYEAALERTPSLEIGQHNAGLAYYKLFQPGVETPENKAYAEKAAAHFAHYLEANPGDRKVIGLLTTIWLDSGQFEKAIAYWTSVLDKDPTSKDVIEKLAGIHRQAGQYEQALAWHNKRLALETDDEGRLRAYLEIAQMQWSRLQKSDLVDFERLAVVDSGLSALQSAAAIDPNQGTVQSLLASLYQHRGLAHQSAWARGIETASWRRHTERFIAIGKAAKAAAPAADTPADGNSPAAAEPAK